MSKTNLLPVGLRMPETKEIVIDGNSLTTDQLVLLGNGPASISISPAAMEIVQRGRRVVDDIVRREIPTYGVNTGFGPLSSIAIPREKLSELSHNIVVSHCGGIMNGEKMEIHHVRAMMAARINTFARGHSGIRPETLERMIKIFNAGLVPSVPLMGSAGASGDLSPLAHMANAMMFGEGKSELWDPKEQAYGPAKDVLQKYGFDVPFKLQAKEGLALVNGTQQMTALGSHIAKRAQNALNNVCLSLSFSLVAFEGFRDVFSPFPSRVRPQKYQADVAKFVTALTAPSIKSHEGEVQDPYSLRTGPVALSTALKYIVDLEETVNVELCSSTDNPLVDPDSGRIISAGDFHGQPIAAALDAVNLFALKPILQTSAARSRRLFEGKRGLPVLLAPNAGLNSGFMIHEIALGALDVPVLSYASHSIETGLGQEDHISHGPEAAIQSLRLLERVEHILSIEFAAAVQAIRLRKWKEKDLPPALRKAFRAVDRVFPHMAQDRNISGDIEEITGLIRRGHLVESCAPK